jgi:hypothetical protein
MTTRKRSVNALALAAVAIAALALTTPASAAPLWTPADITTELWLDASDASTITETAGAMSQWNDKSGNARNATQATAANQPTTGALTQNGLNVISFDGTNDYFDLGTGLDWMAGTSHVAFGVLLNTNYSNLYGAATNGGANANRLHVGFRDATAYRMNFWANDYNPAITANYNVGQYNFMRWDWSQGGNKSIYANAKLEGTGGSPAGTIAAMSAGGRINNVVVGGNQGILDMELAELVFVEGTPTQDTIDKIEGYLAWKWGLQANLPSGHAYENAAPIPEPATMSLLALGGLAVLRRRRRRA